MHVIAVKISNKLVHQSTTAIFSLNSNLQSASLMDVVETCRAKGVYGTASLLKCVGLQAGKGKKKHYY